MCFSSQQKNIQNSTFWLQQEIAHWLSRLQLFNSFADQLLLPNRLQMIPVNHMSHIWVYRFCFFFAVVVLLNWGNIAVTLLHEPVHERLCPHSWGDPWHWFQYKLSRNDKGTSQSLSQFLPVLRQPWLCARAGPLGANTLYLTRQCTADSSVLLSTL